MNLLLVGGNMAEVHHQSVLLTEVPGEVQVHSHPSNSLYVER